MGSRGQRGRPGFGRGSYSRTQLRLHETQATLSSPARVPPVSGSGCRGSSLAHSPPHPPPLPQGSSWAPLEIPPPAAPATSASWALRLKFGGGGGKQSKKSSLSSTFEEELFCPFLRSTTSHSEFSQMANYDCWAQDSELGFQVALAQKLAKTRHRWGRILSLSGLPRPRMLPHPPPWLLCRAGPTFRTALGDTSFFSEPFVTIHGQDFIYICFKAQFPSPYYAP